MFPILDCYAILFGVIQKLIFKAGAIMIEVSVMYLAKMLSRNSIEDINLISFAEHIK